MLGLRPRLLAALVLTAAVTLLVAALALLQPLQDRLREQTAQNVRAAALTARPAFERALRRDESVAGLAQDLAVRLDARVRVYDGIPNAEGDGEYDTEPDAPDDGIDLIAALNGDPPRTRTEIRDERLRLAVPLFVGRDRVFVLGVRKRFTDVSAAVAEVRRAFGAAALAGLAIAALLAFALSATLVRRLERLRQAALRNEPAPYDKARDEVGDLARAFASMQEGLRRQEAARRAFVATASHELRTPLTSIRVNLELLDDDLTGGRVDLDDAHDQITRAQRQLGRLEHLATDLLDLSKLDAEVELHIEPVELGEIGRAVAAEFEVRAADRDVRLEVVPPRGPCWGRGDSNAVARIVRILLDNALRFAPAGSAIRVAAAYAGEVATIAVADAGPGIPETERARIFERFQRGTLTGGEGGFGLGLAIGRELAERLGGRLELADDERGGPGARFVLSLPIELPAGSHAQPTPVA